MPLPVLTAVVLAELRSRFGPGLLEPRPLAMGAWSRAYALAVDGRELVVRVGHHGEDYLKDAAAATRFASSVVPVPEVLAGGEADGLCYVVSERMPGTALDDLDAEQVERVLPSLLGVLDAIGSADLAGTAGFGIWRSDGTAPHRGWAEALLEVGEDRPRFPGWRDTLAASPIGMGPFERGLRQLQGLVGQLPDLRELVHSDLLSRNVLVSGDTVAGVLDWGNSMYGDSLYDAAWLIFCWSLYPQWKSVDIRARLREHLSVGGRPPAGFDERIHTYEIHIALGAVAACAFRGRWDQVELFARTVSRLAAA
ncbi:phosphotransferase family protein [Streptacidiphilus sp. N1-12]|uniref:Phosphotransferase family protein n=2 Tax=Streptacidiphilus alkalitolerans TaxID=3342712 RepID=A0ABV6WNJ2_9ACTN